MVKDWCKFLITFFHNFLALFLGECASFYASYDFSHFSLDQCHRWTRAPVPCRRYELPRKAKLSMAYKYESKDNQGIVLTSNYLISLNIILAWILFSFECFPPFIYQNQCIKWGNYLNILRFCDLKSCLFVFHSQSLTRTCFPGMFWNSKKLVF